MTAANEYATLDDFKRLKGIEHVDSLDDIEIIEMIKSASRMIDVICGRRFYAYTETRYFDVPGGRELLLDEDLLTITTLTNGDGTVLTTSDYYTLPKNESPKFAIVLKQSSNYAWECDTNGNSEGVISVDGKWGYVDRTATDPFSVQVIQNTQRACLMICKMWNDERFGVNTGGTTYITVGGVVQAPAGAIPKAAYDMIKPYIRMV